MRVALLLAILALGCHGPRRQAWVGSPEAALVERWGAPDAALGLRGGAHVLIWERHWRDGKRRYTCRQNFTIRDGVVTGWSYKDCEARFLMWNVPTSGTSR